MTTGGLKGQAACHQGVMGVGEEGGGGAGGGGRGGQRAWKGEEGSDVTRLPPLTCESLCYDSISDPPCGETGLVS